MAFDISLCDWERPGFSKIDSAFFIPGAGGECEAGAACFLCCHVSISPNGYSQSLYSSKWLLMGIRAYGIWWFIGEFVDLLGIF